MYQPVMYKQIDPKWKNISYSAKGETTTIGASGCGPTSMAMVLATWCDKNVTPVTECAWALKNGYKAPHQGTYYGYFKPAAARYGLNCYMLNGSNIYGNSSSKYHATAKQAIDSGHLVIACMGKGLWTSSGHFVLVYNIKGNTIYINDPASYKDARQFGDYNLFKQQVKYYFVIEKPNNVKSDSGTGVNNTKTENKVKDELDMTIPEFLSKISDADAYFLLQKAMQYMATLPEADWSKEEGYWQKATENKIVDGSNPEGFARRDEVVTILGRKGLI